MPEKKQDTIFSAEEWLRYTRHIQLPQLGTEGQAKLKDSHAVIVGAGGLGSPVSLYLTAAGIGEITLIDHDDVDLTNLQRQILFCEEDRNKNKAHIGANKLSALNSSIRVNPVNTRLNTNNAETMLQNASIVLDCTDNFETRYLINTNCRKLNIPWVSASIRQFSAQLALFSNKTACFECLYPTPPNVVDDCNSAGVIGVLPGIAGTFQANEAIKYLCGLNTPLEGKLLLIDALSLSFQKVQFSKNPDCPTCSEYKEGQTQAFSAQSKSVTEKQREILETATQYNIYQEEFDELRKQEQTLVIDVRTEQEHQGFNLGGLHIPLSNLEKYATEIPKETTILCYCQSGARSQSAVALLRKIGFEAFSLENGIAAYLKSKH